MPTWQLRAFGVAELRDETGETRLTPERKTAALLVYLALAGPTPRGRLAGLLWPDSSETSARNNLSQTLRRLRLATSAALVVGDDVLRLSPELSVDAAEHRVDLFTGEDRSAPGGPLLAQYDFDDCPDFADWLYAETQERQEREKEALVRRRDAAQARGDLPEAIRLCERLIARDPLQEAVYRSLMLLHYQLGDRAGALRAFQRCRETLQRELGVAPLPETLQLAEKIDRGDAALPPAQPAPALPLELLRPPRLVGREAAWQRLEAAWAAGQTLFVSGPAGIGKTRLARDFAASRGAFRSYEGRSGDASVPYASLVRALRAAVLELGSAALPAWVRDELARLLPELGAPAATRPEGDLRFLEALAWVFGEVAARGPALSVIDGLEAMDTESLAALRYVYRTLASAPDAPGRAIFTYRTGDLAPPVQQGIERQVAAGQAALVELGSLARADALSLLGDLLPGADPRLAEDVLRYAGGNPFFILETLRHLHASGSVGRALPPDLPPPDPLSALVRERLRTLGESARRVAQAAAVLQGDVDLAVVAQMLGRDVLELLPACEELQRAGVLSGERFSHDLLRETLRQDLPAPVATLLHERALGALTARGATPALLAHHAERAGRLERAFSEHLKAATAAMQVFVLQGAGAHYERAHAILTEQPDLVRATEPRQLRDLYYQYGFILVYTNAFEQARTLHQEALDLGKRTLLPELEWLALNQLAYLAVHDGQDVAAASDYLTTAVAVAAQADDPRLLVEAHQEAAGLYTLAFAPETALEHAEAALAAARTLGDEALLARSLMEAELATWQLGRWEASLDLLEQAADLYTRLGDPALEARARHSLAFDLVASGRAEAGVRAARTALRLSRRAHAQREEVNALGVLALGLREAGLLGEALERAAESLALAREVNVPVVTLMALRRLATVQMDLSLLDEAAETLAEAVRASAGLARRPRSGEVAALRCHLATLRGDPDAALAEARAAALARDFGEAEPWVARGPVVAALARSNDAVGLAHAVAACHKLLAKSPRHRLEGLRALAEAEPEPARLPRFEEALGLARALALPLDVRHLAEACARLRDPADPAGGAALLEARAALETVAATLPPPLRARFMTGATLTGETTHA